MFKKQFQHKKKQAGLTLVEVLSAIIVGVLVIVGSLSLYNNTQNKQRENDLMTSLMTIQTNIRDLYYGKNSYPADTTTIENTLIVAGGAPKSLVNSAGDALVSPYDSSETIVIEGTGPQFTITIPSVPSESCVSLAGRLGSFESVSVEGTPVTGDSDAAAAACDVAAGADVTYTSN